MKRYSGYEYLCIDIANQYGLDKSVFEDRIAWTQSNIDNLESLADKAETPNLYRAAVMALRRAQKGEPIGYLVGVDSVCSGIQIMSALTGCKAGGEATGLVFNGQRPDAYKSVTDEMNRQLGGTVNISRALAKQATMTAMYGSKKVPKEIFGEGTVELDAFYQALFTVAPGPYELLGVLINSWNKGALYHQWKMPDGFDVKIKVMVKKSARIQVDELSKSSFTYEYYDNEGTDKGLSLGANVVHSVDAYICRSMHRRCNYDRVQVEKVFSWITEELVLRTETTELEEILNPKVRYYVEQLERSTVVDVTIVGHLDRASVSGLSTAHLKGLWSILKGMLQYQPFELVTIHDAFHAHPNHINWVRWQYKEILAELAESELLSDLLSQIQGARGTYTKLSKDLGDDIRDSEYALF
jgi:hypothetical protein